MRTTLEPAGRRAHEHKGPFVELISPARRVSPLQVALVLPLIFGAAAGVVQAAWWLFTLGDGVLAGFVNALIALAPAVVYVLATLAVLRGRTARPAWALFLACGLALTAVALYVAHYEGFGLVMIVPPYLGVLALVQLLRRHRPLAAASG